MNHAPGWIAPGWMFIGALVTGVVAMIVSVIQSRKPRAVASCMNPMLKLPWPSSVKEDDWKTINVVMPTCTRSHGHDGLHSAAIGAKRFWWENNT